MVIQCRRASAPALTIAICHAPDASRRYPVWIVRVIIDCGPQVVPTSALWGPAWGPGQIGPGRGLQAPNRSTASKRKAPRGRSGLHRGTFRRQRASHAKETRLYNLSAGTARDNYTSPFSIGLPNRMECGLYGDAISADLVSGPIIFHLRRLLETPAWSCLGTILRISR